MPAVMTDENAPSVAERRSRWPSPRSPGRGSSSRPAGCRGRPRTCRRRRCRSERRGLCRVVGTVMMASRCVSARQRHGGGRLRHGRDADHPGAGVDEADEAIAPIVRQAEEEDRQPADARVLVVVEVGGEQVGREAVRPRRRATRPRCSPAGPCGPAHASGGKSRRGAATRPTCARALGRNQRSCNSVTPLVRGSRGPGTPPELSSRVALDKAAPDPSGPGACGGAGGSGSRHRGVRQGLAVDEQRGRSGGSHRAVRGVAVGDGAVGVSPSVMAPSVMALSVMAPSVMAPSVMAPSVTVFTTSVACGLPPRQSAGFSPGAASQSPHVVSPKV